MVGPRSARAGARLATGGRSEKGLANKVLSDGIQSQAVDAATPGCETTTQEGRPRLLRGWRRTRGRDRVQAVIMVRAASRRGRSAKTIWLEPVIDKRHDGARLSTCMKVAEGPTKPGRQQAMQDQRGVRPILAVTPAL